MNDQIDRSWKDHYVHHFDKATKDAVIKKYGTKCWICGRQLTLKITKPGRRQVDILQIHHVKSESVTHDQSVDNLRPGCPDCNMARAFERGESLYYTYEGDSDAYRWFKCDPKYRAQLAKTLRYVPYRGWRGDDFQ